MSVSQSRPAPPPHRLRWLKFLVILPCAGAFLGFGVGLISSYVAPKRFESVATVQIRSDPSAIDAPGERAWLRSLESEIPHLESAETLKIVVDRLDLPSRWDGISHEKAVETLREKIATEREVGTDLVRIRVRHHSAQEARDLAAAVVEAYAELRRRKDLERTGRALRALDLELRKQEEKVEAQRSRLERLAPAGDPDLKRAAVTQEYEFRRMKLTIEAQRKALAVLKGDDRIKYAAGLDQPNNEVPVHYNELLLERRERDTLQASGLGESHPAIRAVETRLVRLQSDLAQAIAELRAELATRSEQLDVQIGEVAERIAQWEDDPDQPARRAARQAYDEEREFLQAMKLDHSAKRVALQVPANPVTLHERPTVASRPVRPRVPLHLSLGSLLGALAGLLLALPVALVRR